VLQCVADRIQKTGGSPGQKNSMLQCVAGRCSVLQCVAVCFSVLQKTGGTPGQRNSVLQCVAVCCRVLQCVEVCRSVLQCVAVCCIDQFRKQAVHLDKRKE